MRTRPRDPAKRETGAAGRPTGAGAPTRRAAQSAATAATPAAVEARPATLPGAAEGRGTPRRAPDPATAGRAMAGSMPATFGRATAPAKPSARPDRYLTAGRAFHADPATAGAGARRASLPTAPPGRGSRRRVQLCWRDVCRRGVGSVADGERQLTATAYLRFEDCPRLGLP